MARVECKLELMRAKNKECSRRDRLFCWHRGRQEVVVRASKIDGGVISKIN